MSQTPTLPNPLQELESEPTDGYSVTHFAFDSDLGWHVELARPSHDTDEPDQTANVNDLPVEVRTALLTWLQSAK